MLFEDINRLFDVSYKMQHNCYYYFVYLLK
jgi:hypothetical protein